MVVRFGNNILSLNVQRQLSRSTDDLARVSERLSSGQRINRASDDAAGLAIATSLRVDARIFTQGIRNLNDGLSALGIAESAMESLTTIADRIQELSTQSMNGTFGDTQRKSLQQEVTALQSEWNRIVESTSFNGNLLLTGNNTRTVLQGGKGVAATLALQVGEAQLAGGLEGFSGETIRISTDSSGNQALGGGTDVSALSADGRFVAFSSTANNLVAGDTNGVSDAFIKDTLTGLTTRISTDSTGNQAVGGASFVRAISADGRYAVLNSLSTNLVSGDTNGVQDVFINDTLTGATTRINTDSAGHEANGSSSVAAISADGRFIAFNSTATNLVANDTNGQQDSFIKDTLTGITTRISTDSAGSQVAGGSTVSAISADGRFVAFWSNATSLVAGDTNAAIDSFVKDTLTGITTRVSTDSVGNQATGGHSTVSVISADGRYVGFNSGATNLVSGDTNGQSDAFIKDILTGVTTRISTTSEGIQATGGGTSISAISADGRFVAMDSLAVNLVSGDTNGEQDSFIKDTLTGATTRISTDRAGNQATGGYSYAAAMSADGRFVAFDSLATNLVTGDTNGQQDSFIKDLSRTGVQQMSGMVVLNRVSAGVTLGLVQNYRDELLEYRSRLGASSSRIATFINTLSAAGLNYSAAESRITDTDIAHDSASAVAIKIKQQVGTSLLAQANLAPQIGLKLLQNA